MVSSETGKAPVAHIWIPEGVSKVKAVVLAQQNMTEERIFKMDTFRKEMKRLGIALIWVAPAFSQNWDPQTGCQSIFEDMMKNIGYRPRSPGTSRRGTPSARCASSPSTAMRPAPTSRATAGPTWNGAATATSTAFQD